MTTTWNLLKFKCNILLFDLSTKYTFHLRQESTKIDYQQIIFHYKVWDLHLF